MTARAIFLTALARATATPATGDTDRAVHALLTLDAGYFLGDWLAPRTHVALVKRLAAGLRPLGGLPLPNGRLHTTLLAQHAREIAAAFGATAWTDAIVDHTAAFVPAAAEDWDTAVLTAARLATESGAGHALLLAHARRRLWELSQPSSAAEPATPPAALIRVARRLALTAGDHGIQVAEAALAECTAAPALARPLAGALRALERRQRTRRYQTASGRSTPRRSSAPSGRSGSTSHQRRNS